MHNKDEIMKILLNPESGLFFSTNKIKSKLKQHNIKITDKEIRQLVDNTELAQIFRTRKKKLITIAIRLISYFWTNSVDDENRIILDKRLKPKYKDRIIKIPNNKDKNILGKDKSGTIIKTRKYKKK